MNCGPGLRQIAERTEALRDRNKVVPSFLIGTKWPLSSRLFHARRFCTRTNKIKERTKKVKKKKIQTKTQVARENKTWPISLSSFRLHNQVQHTDGIQA